MLRARVPHHTAGSPHRNEDQPEPARTRTRTHRKSIHSAGSDQTKQSSGKVTLRRDTHFYVLRVFRQGGLGKSAVIMGWPKKPLPVGGDHRYADDGGRDVLQPLAQGVVTQSCPGRHGPSFGSIPTAKSAIKASVFASAVAS